MNKTFKEPVGTHTYEGKEYNVFRFFWEEFNKTVDLFFVRYRYSDNNTLAIEAYDTEEEPWADMTVNLRDPHQCLKNHAFFDINNIGWMEKQLKEYGLMKPSDDKYTKDSGFIKYPLCLWDIDQFRVGGEKPKYYVDFAEHRNGQTFGSMSWTFEDKPETETEDLEAAKKMAEEAIEDFPYDKNDECQSIIELYVVDEDGNEKYSVVNVTETVAKANGITANKYIETK